MTVVLNNRKDFTLDNLRRVGCEGEAVRISAKAKQAMAKMRQSFFAYLESDSDRFIYGITSGAGQRASVRLTPEEQQQYLRSQARVPAGGGFGPDALPERVVRMILFARLANYIEGHAKTRPVEADRIAGLLKKPLPRVPISGQTGAGEILPLFHVMRDMPPDDVELAEPMARVNGSPVATALLGDVALTARRRLALATEVFALSIEAYGAPLAPYSASLVRYSHSVHERCALKTLRQWLVKAPQRGRLRHQAPVSWRILPQILAAAEEAVATVEETAAISLHAVTDNPVYILPDREDRLGRVISTGGYHNAQAAPAIDDVNARFADLCTLADRQTMKLHSAEHLPDSLTLPGGKPYGTTLLSFVQVGYGEEARLAARRSFLPASEGGGVAGQNDVATAAMLAYQKHLKAGFCLDACLALLAASASQALFVTGRQPAPKLAPLLKQVRKRFAPFDERDQRETGVEMDSLRQYFCDRVTM